MEGCGSESPLSEVPSNLAEQHDRFTAISARLGVYVPRNPGDDTASFLLQVFENLGPDGQSNLVDDISECDSDGKVQQVAENIYTGLLVPMKAAGDKSGNITPSPRTGASDSVENLGAQIDESLTRDPQEQLRRRGLSREGGACIVSKYFDYNKRHLCRPDRYLGMLECAHIFPFALGRFRNDAEQHQVAAIWTTIYRYFPEVRSRLNFHYHNVSDIENVMILEATLHKLFGKFMIALEPTDTLNTYKIRTFCPLVRSYSFHLPASRTITLRSHDGREPLPSPVLLGAHAAIAKILYATGRGETVDQSLDDYRSAGGMAEDGRTDISNLLSIGGLSLMATPNEAGANKGKERRKSKSPTRHHHPQHMLHSRANKDGEKALPMSPLSLHKPHPHVQGIMDENTKENSRVPRKP